MQPTDHMSTEAEPKWFQGGQLLSEEKRGRGEGGRTGGGVVGKRQHDFRRSVPSRSNVYHQPTQTKESNVSAHVDQSVTKKRESRESGEREERKDAHSVITPGPPFSSFPPAANPLASPKSQILSSQSALTSRLPTAFKCDRRVDNVSFFCVAGRKERGNKRTRLQIPMQHVRRVDVLQPAQRLVDEALKVGVAQGLAGPDLLSHHAKKIPRCQSFRSLLRCFQIEKETQRERKSKEGRKEGKKKGEKGRRRTIACRSASISSSYKYTSLKPPVLGSWTTSRS